jgi:hypothetical protein
MMPMTEKGHPKIKQNSQNQNVSAVKPTAISQIKVHFHYIANKQIKKTLRSLQQNCFIISSTKQLLLKCSMPFRTSLNLKISFNETYKNPHI